MARLLVAQGRGKSKVESRGQLSWREGTLGRSLLTVGMGNRGRQGPDRTLHGSFVTQRRGVQLTPVSGQFVAGKQPLPQVDSLRLPDGSLKD